MIGEWNFLSRTIGDIGRLLQPLEDAIRQQFLPALTGRSQPGDTERELMALPAGHGGLGMPKCRCETFKTFQTSERSKRSE